jgi:hypothetical protein
MKSIFTTERFVEPTARVDHEIDTVRQPMLRFYANVPPVLRAVRDSTAVEAELSVNVLRDIHKVVGEFLADYDEKERARG